MVRVSEQSGSVEQGGRLRLRHGVLVTGFSVECRVRVGDPIVKDFELDVSGIGFVPELQPEAPS